MVFQIHPALVPKSLVLYSVPFTMFADGLQTLAKAARMSQCDLHG